jgi:prepilin-type N-terminal cleavage/methylation domain-containing protein
VNIGAIRLHSLRKESLYQPPARAGGYAGERRRAPAASKRGFTLIELMLVLVLLVIAGSLALPAITGAFASVRLRRAGDAVLAHWAQARARAIETGVAYQFTFTPESGDYRLEPWTGAPLDDRSATTAPTTTAVESATAAAEAEETGDNLMDSAIVAAKLPDSVVFQGGQRATIDPLSGETRIDPLQAGARAAPSPILFFPDGAASQATIVLQNDRSQYVRLTIRGLTGVARASAVLTREEMDRGAETR